jgi:hypothetical protein
MAQDPQDASAKGMRLPFHPAPDKPILTTQQAQKAEAGVSSGFSLFGGRQENWEGAAELYSQGICSQKDPEKAHTNSLPSCKRVPDVEAKYPLAPPFLKRST